MWFGSAYLSQFATLLARTRGTVGQAPVQRLVALAADHVRVRRDCSVRVEEDPRRGHPGVP